MPKNKIAGTPPATDWTDPDDAPELTEEFFAKAEVYHGDTFVRRGRGRPATGNAKEQVSVRLDQDVLAKLRASGPGWQSKVNAMLRTGLELDRATDTDKAIAGIAILTPGETGEVGVAKLASRSMARRRLIDVD